MKKILITLAVGILFVAGYLALWMMGGKISTTVVQIINWIILAAIVAVSVYFVGIDTRRRAFS
jgi:Na+(H+)/acetate symporter ActP